MSQDFDRRLIFDIGLHKGFDAQYYIAKGFKVIGLEARADLCAVVADKQKEAVASGKLVIVQRALFHKSGEKVSFYVNPDKDDWGSLFRGSAEKGIGKAQEITVETITLADLFAEHGRPYYIKCDIEGGDQIFVQQLLQQPYRPSFVSVEINGISDMARLFAAGYDAFQIVNQQLNTWTKAPNPAREGEFVDQRFSGEMSGLFGHDLPEKNWQDFEKTAKNILDWRDLAVRDKALAIGWLDVHATTRATLKAGASA